MIEKRFNTSNPISASSIRVKNLQTSGELSFSSSDVARLGKLNANSTTMRRFSYYKNRTKITVGNYITSYGFLKGAVGVEFGDCGDTEINGNPSGGGWYFNTGSANVHFYSLVSNSQTNSLTFHIKLNDQSTNLGDDYGSWTSLRIDNGSTESTNTKTYASFNSFQKAWVWSNAGGQIPSSSVGQVRYVELS